MLILLKSIIIIPVFAEEIYKHLPDFTKVSLLPSGKKQNPFPTLNYPLDINHIYGRNVTPVVPFLPKYPFYGLSIIEPVLSQKRREM
jgi:hypothetical protein